LETCTGIPHILEDCTKVTTNPDGSKTFADTTHVGPMTQTNTWDIPAPETQPVAVPSMPSDLGPALPPQQTNMFDDPMSTFNPMSPTFVDPNFGEPTFDPTFDPQPPMAPGPLYEFGF